jgi:hypothetical protein
MIEHVERVSISWNKEHYIEESAITLQKVALVLGMIKQFSRYLLMLKSTEDDDA